MIEHPDITDRTRIAFLFGHLHKGGMQRAVSNISCALPESIKQYIVYFGTENPGFEYKAEMINLDIPGSMNSGAAQKAVNFARRINSLQQFIDRNRIETLISFGETANIINCLTRRKKTILSVRVSLEEGFKQSGKFGAVSRQLVNWLYRKANVVVPVSHALAQQLKQQYGVPQQKLKVIYNLYDLNKIRHMKADPVSAKWEPIFENPTVINVGSLIHQKGQEHLIRGFTLAKRNIPDLQLIIIGSGELKPALLNLSESLSVAKDVHFIDFDANPYKYLSRAGVFAMTSQFEGFPNVLAEAMICGLPVIATDCKTGPREILGESEYGILLPDIDSENQSEVEQNLADSIAAILEPSNADRYRTKALIRAEDFSQERIISSWLEIL